MIKIIDEHNMYNEPRNQPGYTTDMPDEAIWEDPRTTKLKEDRIKAAAEAKKKAAQKEKQEVEKAEKEYAARTHGEFIKSEKSH